jgi:hypothetical protein
VPLLVVKESSFSLFEEEEEERERCKKKVETEI